MANIHDRSPDVEERLAPGHWEGDLLKGVLGILGHFVKVSNSEQ